MCGAKFTGVNFERLSHSGIVLLLRNIPGSKHTIEHHVAARGSSIGVYKRVVTRRRLRQTRNHSCLREGKIFGRGIKVGNCRSLNTICTMSKVNGVEVHIKNLVFGVNFFHLNGNICLAHFTAQRLLKLLF